MAIRLCRSGQNAPERAAQDVTTLLMGLVRSARFRALLSLGMVLGLGAVGTLAAWSASTTTTSGAFTTGYVDIQLADSPAAYSVVFTSPTTLLPGQSISAVLPIRNVGNLPVTYTSSFMGSGAMGLALQLKVTTDQVVKNNTCEGTAVTGTPAAVTSTGTTFGGTRGTLAPTVGTESLCLQFTLPPTASSALQGQTGSVVFSFSARSVP